MAANIGGDKDNLNTSSFSQNALGALGGLSISDDPNDPNSSLNLQHALNMNPALFSDPASVQQLVSQQNQQISHLKERLLQADREKVEVLENFGYVKTELERLQSSSSNSGMGGGSGVGGGHSEETQLLKQRNVDLLRRIEELSRELEKGKIHGDQSLERYDHLTWGT